VLFTPSLHPEPQQTQAHGRRAGADNTARFRVGVAISTI
jgi:hypothetical protein